MNLENKKLIDGIEIDKGAVLSQYAVDSYADVYQKWLEFWILYPDLYLDAIHSDEDDPNFHIYPYQRILLRSIMRKKNVSITATRGTSKSFTAYLAYFLRCTFSPGIQLCIVADVKKTVIATAKQKYEEIFKHWPLLRKELKTREDDGEQGQKKSNDYYELDFKNGSILTVISKDSSRGLREHGILYEESAKIDEISHNEILQPMMTIDRREPDGTINETAPNGQSIYITTAAEKTCFMYSKLLEIVVNSILRPEDNFVIGFDYKVPVRYGLMTQAKIDTARLSSTFSEDSFAREYCSIWTGNSTEAWFDADMLVRRRTLLTCERKNKLNRSMTNCFYLISCDVGRFRCNTAITVLKVMPREEHFHANLVYMEVLNGDNFITQQAPRLKKLIGIYNPREVIIDTNGLGAGLMDAMVVESYDPVSGEKYPPYYGFNLDQHLPPGKKSPTEEPIPSHNAIIYEMKSNDKLESEMLSNMYSRICGNFISLLAQENVIKSKLLATTSGQKMTLYDRRVFLLPYEMTSRLIDELNNLRLKPGSSGANIKVEQITRSTPKDRVSSFEYGLWRVKYYEDKFLRKQKNKSGGKKNFVFFSPRNRR